MTEKQQQQSLRVVENHPAGGEHLLQCVDETQVHWHDDEHDNEHHHKKTIMEKVRHKAKKWRQTLTKKKHVRDEDSSTPTSTCSAASGSIDENNEADEPHPEFHGAPMYESETARDAYKDRSPKTPNLKHHHSSSRDADKKPVLNHLDSFKETSHDSTAAATADKAVEEFRTKQGMTVSTNNNKTLTETVTEMLSPAYNMVSDATQMIASKIQSPMGRDEIGAKMMWDKSVSGGVYVKEYLRNKLEPGEEDRALSEVITEAISPRKAGPRQQGGETSVVEKVRRALSSLMGKEELTSMGTHPTQPTARPLPNSKPLREHTRSQQDSLPVPVPVPLATYLGVGSSPFPAVSTNSYTEAEELGARKLQACAN